MKRWIAALVAVLVLASATPQAQTFSAQIQAFWQQLRTGGLTFVTLHLNASSYANWGAALQASGYGLRDSAGTMQVKNSGGSWTNILAAGAGNAPADATYITQTPNATLTAEQALSALGTALLLNATGTGVLSAYAGSTCTNQVVTALSAVGAATCTTITSAYVSNTIALTGTDINTSSQVTATHLAAALPVAQGGTSFTTYAVGDLLYADTTTTLAKRAAVAAGQVLASAGTSTAPAYTASPTLTAITLTAGTGTQTGGDGGITILSNVTPVTSLTSGTIDGQSYSMPANTLSANGQSLLIQTCGAHAANANAASIAQFFNGTSLRSMTSSTTGDQECIETRIVRLTVSTLNYFGWAEDSANGTLRYGAAMTGQDFTNPIIIKNTITGATTNGDMTATFMKVVWFP